MVIFTSHIKLQTAKRIQVVDVTDLVDAVLLESKIKNGILTLFSAHTSAALYIGIVDEKIPEDFVDFTGDLVPNRPTYKHNLVGGRNADAHLKSILIGNSLTIPVTGSKMELGKWQGLFFAEFSGPKERKVTVKVMGEKE